jgi:tripartite-type tricarboxylate transporter receptor subunit TctC
MVLGRLHCVVIGIGVAAAMAGVGIGAVAAQDFPTRPVTIIVASTPGGGTDIISRIIGEQLSKQLGQPFVVVNMPAPAR